MKNLMETSDTGDSELVEELLAGMTLREKFGQCIMIEPCFCLEERVSEEFGESYKGIEDPAYLDKLLNEYHIGTFLFGGASRVGDGSPRAWADYLARVNEHAGTTRHRVPLLFGIDAVHGVNFIKGSTIYSHNLGMSATWNPELMRDYASLVGAELAAIGFNCNFAPTIDVARDPRWGRVYESLGEDPYLASELSRALVGGLQDRGDLAACAKHFIGYGESNNGMDRTPADLSERAILETHAPPFEAAIESGVLCMMVAGGDLNAVPMPASRKVLSELLRDRLGFKGVTMSDWEDVYRLYSRHKIVRDRKEAITRAFNAGLDMNMAVADIGAVDTMVELVEEGRIPLERVDSAARNVLNLKSRLGLFTRTPVDSADAGTLVGSEPSRSVARQLAQQSMTLLKNEQHLLPLAKNTKSILLVGSHANSRRHLCGGWTLGWDGAEEQDLECRSLSDAIRAIVSAETVITHVETPEPLQALETADQGFDVCICVISEEPHSEWLGDSMDLQLDDNETQMLRAAAATGIPVVLVGLLGRPLDIRWAASNIPAILWAYSPGTEGADAIAEVLFGDFNPCGRLPLSFPRDATQIPVVYDARRYESDEISTRYDPLYPFGFGLSYTDFVYSDLKVPARVAQGQDVDVSVKVKNAGEVEGTEVVQLFLRDSYASVTRPLKSLKAFDRVTLGAGEEQTVSLTLTPRQLSLYDENLDFVEESREIAVLVGGLTQRLTIE